jgi:hypothetical protein
MVTAEFNGMDEFNEKVLSLIGELGIPFTEVFPQEAKLLAEECMRRTPPFPGGNAAGSNSSDAKKAGEVTVEGDVNRAQTPASLAFEHETTNKYLRKIIRKKEVEKLRKSFEHIPSMRNWKVSEFSSTHHKKARGPTGTRYKVKGEKHLTLDDRAQKSYLKEEKKKPGWMKSGWGIALSLLQGRVPAWISRHFPTAPGGMEMNVDEKNPAPFVHIWNNAPTIGKYNSNYEFAINERIRSIGVKVDQALERRLKNKFKQ